MSLFKRVKDRLKQYKKTPKKTTNNASQSSTPSTHCLQPSLLTQEPSKASPGAKDLPVRSSEQDGTVTAQPTASTSKDTSTPKGPEPTVAPPAAPSIDELRDGVWKRALEKLRAEQEDLVVAFEALVKEQNGLSQTTALGADSMTDVVSKQKEIMASKQWTYTWFGLGKEHKVRDTVETIFGVIQQASGLISLGMQAAPPAVSLPWTMVTILIPFIANDIHAVDGAISGLQEVTSILASYSYAEREFLPVKETCSDFQDIVLELYVSILEYQASVALYFAKSTLKRIGINLVPKQSWTEALAKTKNLEQRCQIPIQSLGVKLTQLGFQSISSGMERGLQLLRDISSAVAAGREYRERIRRWISKVNPYDDHDAVRTRLGEAYVGSGQWLLSDKETFLPWKHSRDGTVLLQGIVGSGKSCLTSIVIESLLNDSDGQVAFMYCSANANASGNAITDTNRSANANILRCILSQLAVLPDGSVARPIQELYEREDGKNTSSMGGGTKPVLSLITDLMQEHHSEQHTFVFDALDECADYDELLRYLADLKSKQNKLRLFFSGRVGVQVGPRIPRHEVVFSTAGNTQDIKSFVEKEVTARYEQVGMQPEQAERLKKALLRLAGGMFRWVELEIALYLPRPTTQKRRVRAKDIEYRLQKLESSDAEPIDLLMSTYEQIYEMALGRPDEEANRATIACAVKWVLCSFRPLTSTELLEAVSIQEDGTYEEDLIEEDILEPCSNLFIKDANGVIRLAHLSVRQFFETKHSAHYAPGMQHRQAMLSCLWIICAFRREEPTVSWNKVFPAAGLWQSEDNERSWSLATYCRYNWVAHYHASEKDPLLSDSLEAAGESLDRPFESLKGYITQTPTYAALDVLLPRASPMHRRFGKYGTLHSLQSPVHDALHKTPHPWEWIRTADSTKFYYGQSGVIALCFGGAAIEDDPASRDGLTSPRRNSVLDIRDADSAGNTALHYAGFFNQPSIIRELLKIGPITQMDHRNLEGLTALQVARQACSYDSLSALDIHSTADLGSKSVELQHVRPKVIISSNPARCMVCDLTTWIEGSRYGKELTLTSLPEFGQHAVNSSCELCTAVHAHLLNEIPDGLQPLDSTVKVRVFLDSDTASKKGKDLLRYSVGETYQVSFEFCYEPAELQKSKADTVFGGLYVDNDYATQLRGWLSACELHECGSSSNKSELPQRLVDLMPSKGADFVRVCTTENLSPTKTGYVYLSFAWGNSATMLLTTSNYQDLTSAIDIALLPRIFQDAISLCRRVGYQYLFVDALCIIQDSREDWVYNAPRLGSYLTNAHVVFAGTSRTTTDSLFPRAVDLDKCTPLVACIQGNEAAPFKLHIREVLQEPRSLMNGKVLSRGWRQQEVFMASRLVLFGEQQLYWSCGKGMTSQSDANISESPWITIPTMQRERRDLSTILPQDMMRRRDYRYWYQLAELNMHGRLSYERDRLVCVADMARLVSKFFDEDTYVAGLWQADLRNGLLWMRKPAGQREGDESSGNVGTSWLASHEDSEGRTYSGYVGPSWSWVTGSGPISYGLVPGLQAALPSLCITSQFAVRDIAVRLDGLDPYGGVIEGSSIQITALSLSAETRTRDFWGGFAVFFDFRPRDEIDGHFVFVIVAPWTYNPQGHSRWAGLIITKSIKMGHEDRYLRQGVFLGPDCGESLDVWELKDFCLI